MIAKHMPMRNEGVSSFAKLAAYITDPQNKQERVGYVEVSNCHSPTPAMAIEEIGATQQKNKRSTSDKTYHLMVSFRPGESPSPEIMAKVEERISAALGYGEHQRVSAAHYDTDNVHIHIAINKIHPTRLTAHTPHNDYKILADVCQKLEAEYGLQADNHQARKRGAENRANDLEHHAGIDSLMGWIRRECLTDIQGAKTWGELHKTLQANGLEIQQRGAGFVFTDGEGVAVKASTVSRELSKAKLEERLGPYQLREGQAEKPVRKYDKKPSRMAFNTVELYARFKDEQSNTAEKDRALRIARAERDRAIEAARRAAKLKRATTRAIGGNHLSKRMLYSKTTETLKDELQQIRTDHKKRIAEIHTKHQRTTWADWLKRQALAGDAEALAALRSREQAKGLKGATVQPAEQSAGRPLPLKVDNITKKGTVIYRAGKATIRDDGARLQVSRNNSTLDDLQAVLRVAAARYGGRLAINGSDEFKERMARAAVAAGLPVTFSDPALEARRQQLAKEVNDVRSRSATSGRPGRTTGRAGQSAATHGNDGRGNRAGAGIGAGRGAATAKPNVAAIGRSPPPQGQNRLRGMSELGLVRITSGSEVLLPGHVPGDVEQQGAKRPESVRWHLFGTRPVRVEEAAAADKYIAERMTKQTAGFDIQNHERYNGGEGALSYAGLRKVDNCSLALLKQGETILVLPVDPQTASRLSRLSIGEAVTVTPRGSISTGRGISR